MTSRFAYVCTIDGTAYPQGCGNIGVVLYSRHPL